MTSARNLARAGLIVSAAFLASRVLGWVRTVVIVNVLAGPRRVLRRVPDPGPDLPAGRGGRALLGAHPDRLGPPRDRRTGPRPGGPSSTVANLVLAALGVLGVIVFIAAPVIVPAITPGFDAAQTAKTVELTRIMILSPIFLALGSVATSVLNAGGRFAASAIAPVTYNLAIIGGALILAPSMGVEGLAIGVVAGSFCHLLVQLRPLRSPQFPATSRSWTSATARRVMP